MYIRELSGTPGGTSERDNFFLTQVSRVFQKSKYGGVQHSERLVKQSNNYISLNGRRENSKTDCS